MSNFILSIIGVAIGVVVWTAVLALLVKPCNERRQASIDRRAERKLAMTPDEEFEFAIRNFDGQ